MTRWLEAALKARGPNDNIDEIDEIDGNPADATRIEGGNGFSSIKSILSSGGTPESGNGRSSAEIIILAAIRAGNHRPGAIATETRMGATAAYQTLDRMREAGLVTVARDGHATASENLGEKANTDEGGRER